MGRFDPIINPEVEKSWMRNLFTYDDKMRLIKITFEESISNYPKLNTPIDKLNLKKNGGFLPDYYEEAIQPFDYYVAMKIHSISFTYDSKGKPAKQIFQFILYGKIKEFLASDVDYSTREEIPPSIIEVKGRKLVFDSLIIDKHNSEIYSKLGLWNYYENKYAKEQSLINCKNLDLNNKSIWIQPLESSFCEGETIVHRTTNTGTNQIINNGIKSNIVDSAGKLVITKHYIESNEKQFNCAKVNDLGNITEFRYTETGKVETETKFLVYKLVDKSAPPKPFCPGQELVTYNLPDGIFLIKVGSTNYNYNVSGLLVSEEGLYYSYSKSQNLNGIGQQPIECYEPCFKLNKYGRQFKLYSYTFHPAK
ncbi:hypothetical protein [Adhaeribacter soli]|uniref:Uncharacterized protein n=1 Tax=Adhaeribacter soli TaxID=2607655 RepID=A0A5N1IUC6_9BACT|nr:hypothetical protein [Adhaeribacter soli]KAA9333541.1 hypothetical protein F0P94_09790 [Adhaeribacter soli]